MSIKKRLQQLENAVLVPSHGGIVDMVREHWNPDFSGNVKQALSVFHEKTLQEAERAKAANQKNYKDNTI